MSSFIHAICDYSPGDLAWSEVVSAIRARVKPGEAEIQVTAVGAFETVATGFVLAQLALGDRSLQPENLVVFANCAPRRDRRTARVDNEGEGLLYARTKGGVHLVAVNSGHSLSFVRHEIEELWSTTAFDRGSQFRSRDFYPQIVANVVHNDFSFKRNQLEAETEVPEPPDGVVGYVDNFGNLKTTYRGPDALPGLAPGDKVQVMINNTVRTATVSSGSFNVYEGDLAFSLGSSGHSHRFWEVFKRGGSAWLEFNRPSAGSKIAIERISPR